MSRRLNWERAKRPRRHESKYGRGVVLSNGYVTPSPKDTLSLRADKAMNAWVSKLSPQQRAELGFTDIA